MQDAGWRFPTSQHPVRMHGRATEVARILEGIVGAVAPKAI